MSGGALRRRVGGALGGSSTLQGLVAAYDGHIDALYRHCGGYVVLAAERVAGHALAGLVAARRLVEAALAQRWVLVANALREGASVGEVGEACGLSGAEVAVGLWLWVAGRRHAGSLSSADAAQLEALLTRPVVGSADEPVPGEGEADPDGTGDPS